MKQIPPATHMTTNRHEVYDGSGSQAFLIRAGETQKPNHTARENWAEPDRKQFTSHLQSKIYLPAFLVAFLRWIKNGERPLPGICEALGLNPCSPKKWERPW
jgi:hypothetical protein